MKRFLKRIISIIKRIRNIILILILLFFLALPILSLLFGYKDSDFNIPENFFDTPHQNDGYKDFSLYPLTYKSNEEEPETTKEIGFYDKLSYYKIDIGIKGSIELKELDEETDKDLEELQTFTLNELGDKKFNYLEKYFSKIDDINFKVPSKYFSLDKDNFQKNNILVEDIKTFLDFLKSKQTLEESKYNIEKLDLTDIGALIAEIYSSKKRGFSEFVEFIDLINLEMEKIIQEKEFFVEESDLEATLNSPQIIYATLIKYYRATSTIAEIYIKEGKYEEGINILIKNQELADNVINRTDKVSSLFPLVFVTLQNINLHNFEYLIDNYQIPNEQKNKILETLKNEIKFGLVENSIKYQYDYGKSTLNWIDKITIQPSSIFYSEKESLVIHRKIFYDLINNKGETSNFTKEITEKNHYIFAFKNPRNWIGRILISGGIGTFRTQRQKEDEMHTKRQQLIDKIEGNLK